MRITLGSSQALARMASLYSQRQFGGSGVTDRQVCWITLPAEP